MSNLSGNIKKFFGGMAAVVRKYVSKRIRAAKEDRDSSVVDETLRKSMREVVFAEMTHKIIEDTRKV